MDKNKFCSVFTTQVPWGVLIASHCRLFPGLAPLVKRFYLPLDHVLGLNILSTQPIESVWSPFCFSKCSTKILNEKRCHGVQRFCNANTKYQGIHLSLSNGHTRSLMRTQKGIEVNSTDYKCATIKVNTFKLQFLTFVAISSGGMWFFSLDICKYNLFFLLHLRSPSLLSRS